MQPIKCLRSIFYDLSKNVLIDAAIFDLVHDVETVEAYVDYSEKRSP